MPLLANLRRYRKSRSGARAALPLQVAQTPTATSGTSIDPAGDGNISVHPLPGVVVLRLLHQEDLECSDGTQSCPGGESVHVEPVLPAAAQSSAAAVGDTPVASKARDEMLPQPYPSEPHVHSPYRWADAQCDEHEVPADTDPRIQLNSAPPPLPSSEGSHVHLPLLEFRPSLLGEWTDCDGTE